MISQEEIELIERYINGDLNESSRKAFDERLNTDAQFSKAYQDVLDMRIAIREIGRENLREKIKSIGENGSRESKSKIIPFYQRSYAIAATIVLLLISAAVLFFVKDKPATISDQISDDKPVFDLRKYLASITIDSLIIKDQHKIKIIDSGFGYGGNIDSIDIIILNDPAYANMYYFQDTLALFLPSYYSTTVTLARDKRDLILFQLIINADTMKISRSGELKYLVKGK